MNVSQLGGSDNNMGDRDGMGKGVVNSSLEPSVRELDLARRVAMLERSNAELQSVSSANTPSLLVPAHMLPVLSQLRTHIASLTADNKALNHLLYSGTDQPNWPEHNINLGLILQRVKKLTRENDELGDMVLAAGRVGGQELDDVLKESAETIVSLEDELHGQCDRMQSVESELAAYKARFGPLTSQPNPDFAKEIRTRASNSGQASNRGRRKPQ